MSEGEASHRDQLINEMFLHVCCGPCAAWPLTDLIGGGARVTGLFYNPNIHPIEELNRRAEGARELFSRAGAELLIRTECMQSEWERYDAENSASATSAQDDPTGKKSRAPDDHANARCEMCYRARLDYTANYARDAGFDSFSTTLLISPYQNHDLIASICAESAKKYGVKFYYIDYRPYFRKSQQMARDMNLYRQKYCGCIISLLN